MAWHNSICKVEFLGVPMCRGPKIVIGSVSKSLILLTTCPVHSVSFLFHKS